MTEPSSEFKLLKAAEALDELTSMIAKDHTVRKTEAYVKACAVLNMLKGGQPVGQA